MNQQEIFLIAFAGGISAVLGLLTSAALALAVYAAVARIVTASEARRERRRHLKTCRAINALGTTDHPTDK